MTQIAVRVKEGSGKQTVPILKRHNLASMQVSGQYQVVTLMACRLPDAWIVSTKDSHVAITLRTRLRAGDGDCSISVFQMSHLSMDPLTVASQHGSTNFVDPDSLIVISCRCEDRCDIAELTHQIAEAIEFGRTINQVASQQHRVRLTLIYGCQRLLTKSFRSPASQMDVADIGHATRILPHRETFFTDMKCEI